MSKNELALIIGEKILNAIQKMQEEKKDLGRFLVIPFKLENTSDDLDWIYSIELKTPRFSYFDGTDFKSITMAEHYGWKK